MGTLAGFLVVNLHHFDKVSLGRLGFVAGKIKLELLDVPASHVTGYWRVFFSTCYTYIIIYLYT